MRARLFLASASIAAVLALGAQPARAVKICAWSIPAEMVDKIDSRSARAGMPFRFEVTQDAASDDGTKIPAGTMGYGVVRASSSAGRHDRDGMLAIEPRYLIVRKPKGDLMRLEVTMNPTLPVTWTPSEPLLNKAASRVPLPVPGLVMTGVNTLRWGRNITLGPGFTFTVLPVDNLARSPVC